MRTQPGVSDPTISSTIPIVIVIMNPTIEDHDALPRLEASA